MSQEQQAALYAQGYRAIVATYNDTTTMHSLAEDGGLAWIGESPRNELDNPDFAIAQAGYGGKHGVKVFAADRWAIYQDPGASVSVSFSENRLVLSSTGGAGSIHQDFPTGSITQNGVMTFVYYDDDGPHVSSPKTSASYDYVDIAVSEDKPRYIYKAALYKGQYTAKTLPPWVAPNYTAELLKCKKHYINYNKSARYAANIDENNGSLWVFIPTPSGEMRIIPTVTPIGYGVAPTINGTYVAPTSVKSVGVGNDGLLVTLSVPSGTYSGTTVLCDFTFSASADL